VTGGMAGGGHARRSTYSKRLSRGQHRYGADADRVYLIESARTSEHNATIESSMCGCDAALCQTTPLVVHPSAEEAIALGK